jgi:hypothetical protein
MSNSKINLDNIKAYWPLIVVVSLSMALPVIQMHDFMWMQFMHHSMGYFLIFLAMLKIFNLKGFRKGFAKYDIVTQKFPIYGLIYPWLEMGLGLCFLSGFAIQYTLWATVLIMGAGGLGVLRSIAQGKKLNCACMGNILAVPLSTVSIIENFSMVAMSLFMLWKHSI